MKIIKNFLVLLLVITSCESEDEFLTKINPNQITTAVFFSTKTDAEAAVNAAYSTLQSGNMYNQFYFSMLDLGIELKANSNMPAGWHISSFSFNSDHETVKAVWRGLYQIVGRANYAIENIEKMEGLDQTLKNRLLGEAHFLRGWAYFELAFHWGRVPIVLKLPVSVADSYVPRSATELMVYQQAISDFEFAKDNLPVSYAAADVGRATKGAAIGYLGKIHLYMASPGVNLEPTGYSVAEGYFNQLVNTAEFSAVYDLMPNYMDNFTWFFENNKESLFEVQLASIGGNTMGWYDHDVSSVGEGTNRARTFGYLTWFNAYMNPAYISRFADTDPRLRYTAYGPPTAAHPEKMTIFGGKTYDRTNWCVRKYERYDYIANEDGDSPINFRVMRFADILLMYAETLIEQNKAGAVPLINRVRQRTSVNMPPLALDLGQDDARIALRDERLWELGLEQIRLKDALRWGKVFADQEILLSGIAGFNYSIYRYLPIPLSEIDFNLAIDNADQNFGY